MKHIKDILLLIISTIIGGCTFLFIGSTDPLIISTFALVMYSHIKS